MKGSISKEEDTLKLFIVSDTLGRVVNTFVKEYKSSKYINPV